MALRTAIQHARHSSLPKFGRRVNIGAYDQPFSGVGMEFDPLGAPPHGEVTLHETGYWPNSHGWNYPGVFSPFWRITYDFQPGHFVQFGQDRIPLGPENLCVIPNHQRFSCLGDEPVPQLWFLFSCVWSVALGTSMPIMIPPDSILLKMIEEFPALFRRRSSEKRRQIRRLSLSLLTYILGDPRIPRRKELPRRIAHVLRAINQAPAHPWSNAELAKLAFMSTEGFIRTFHRWVGETPIRYLQQIRVREACRFLADESLSIKQVAEMTGFCDRYYFSRVFRQRTEMSPGQYRKEVIKGVRPL